jgi:hypothetical protein
LADVEQVDGGRADLGVVLHLAARALVNGLWPLPYPLGHQARLLGGDGVHRLVHRQEVVVHLLAVVLVVPLLVRHPGRAHQERRDGVAVLGDEEVVRVVVAVLRRLVVEPVLDARSDHVVDHVERKV